MVDTSRRIETLVVDGGDALLVARPGGVLPYLVLGGVTRYDGEAPRWMPLDAARWKVSPLRRGLPVIWKGLVVPEGCDRVVRFLERKGEPTCGLQTRYTTDEAVALAAALGEWEDFSVAVEYAPEPEPAPVSEPSSLRGYYVCRRCGAEWDMTYDADEDERSVRPGAPCSLGAVPGQDPDDGSADVTCGELGGVVEVFVTEDRRTTAGTLTRVLAQATPR